MPQFQPKLKVEQVRSIRRLFKNGATKAWLSRKFGVTPRQIWNIVNHKVWVHTGHPRPCRTSPSPLTTSLDPAPGGEGSEPCSTTDEVTPASST